MEQRRAASYTSSPYQYMAEYPGAHDLTRCNSEDAMICSPGQSSYDEKTVFHNFGRDTSNTRSLSTPTDAFDPWLLEGPPCGSPLSTSSSITHSENVPTPPYTTMGMYEPMESAFHHIREAPTSHGVWTSEPEPMWRPSYAEANPWGEPTYVLPYHGGSSGYQNMPVQPVQNFIPPVTTSAGPPFMTFDGPSQYKQTRATDSAPFHQDDFNSNGGDSSEGSDSEDDESDYDDDSSSSSPSTSKKRYNGPHGNIIKLEGLTTGVDPFITARVTNYQCQLRHKENPAVPCLQKFARPEHLRRHLRTTHSTARPWICKVEGCKRPFSRGDNLRDHYFTHINRGGRVGKNKKMDFLELKAILGPKEKKLARKLKQKLQKNRDEQNRKQIRAKL